MQRLIPSNDDFENSLDLSISKIFYLILLSLLIVSSFPNEIIIS